MRPEILIYVGAGCFFVGVIFGFFGRPSGWGESDAISTEALSNILREQGKKQDW